MMESGTRMSCTEKEPIITLMEENTRADGSTVVATDQVRDLLPAIPPPYLNPLFKGTFQWPNGDKFEGEFVKDQCHGVGVHTYADGKQYQGEWLDNKKHGYGILIYPRGEKTEGLLLSPRTRKLTSLQAAGNKISFVGPPFSQTRKESATRRFGKMEQGSEHANH